MENPNGRNNSYHREALTRFTKAMTRKLRAHEQKDNGRKPGWKDENIRELFDAMMISIDDVDHLLFHPERGKPFLSDIEEACADVANWAMMIADWHREKNRAYY